MNQSPFSEKLKIGEKDFSPTPGDSNFPCPAHFKNIFNCKTARVIPAGSLIFSQGDITPTVCLICKGLVKLTHTESDGSRVIVGLREQGDMLGVASLIQKKSYPVTAEAITRSKLCFVSTETFNTLFGSDLQFSRLVATKLCNLVTRSLFGIIDIASLSGRKRLEKFLWALLQLQCKSIQQTPAKIQMILKNWEVAQLLCLTPQHLCRLVRDLEKEGVIVKKKGWLIIPEPKKIMPLELVTNELS